MKYFVIFLILIGFVGTAFGFEIHNIDYENSPYEYKTMPSIDKPIQFVYQVVNHTPKVTSYDVTITITNIDDGYPLYSEQRHYDIQPEKVADVLWNFAPRTDGLYLVKVEENEKTTKYFFAVPKNDDLRRMAKTDPSLVADKSPRQQFRIGIDPKEIICKGNLYLALKPTSLPVCVSLETLQELRQRDLVVSEFINYEKIGHFLSDTEFKRMLGEKNIEYKQNDFMLIQGWMLPMGIPEIGYCGYVLAEDNEDYWFSSTALGFNLTRYQIRDENPEPCKVGDYSCGCSLQTSLVEKNLNELSYFDEVQEAEVGKIFADYLNEGGKIANAPNSFVIGKYNLEISPDVTSFCGQFQGRLYWHFIGYINGSKIDSWSLETNERPKLCAIKDKPQIFTFDESAIVKN